MILNIAAFLFVAIDDADALAVRLRERAEADALRGSVLVAPEGINLFLAGDEARLGQLTAAEGVQLYRNGLLGMLNLLVASLGNMRALLERRVAMKQRSMVSWPGYAAIRASPACTRRKAGATRCRSRG